MTAAVVQPESSSSSPAWSCLLRQTSTDVRGAGRDDPRCSWPSHPRTASCRPRPWPRMALAACRSRPSTSRREPCRLGLIGKYASVWEGVADDRTAPTEGDAGVLIPDVLALLVGEEHIGRKTTLGRVRVWVGVSDWDGRSGDRRGHSPFFFFSPPRALVLRVVVFSFGILKSCGSM